MKVKCPSCGAQYNLDPTKIADAGIKVRCPSCSHVFVVRKKAPEPAPAPAAAPGNPAAITSRTASRMGSEDEPIALDAGMPDHVHSAAEEEVEAAEHAPVGVPTDVGDFFDKPMAGAPKPAAPQPAAPPPPPAPAAPPPPPAAPAAGGEPDAGGFTGEGDWRVKKSGLGLVYGPADIGTIESWIKAERVGAQDLYSLNGGDWIPPGNFQIIAEMLRVPYEGPPEPEAVAKAHAAHAERTAAAAAAPAPPPPPGAPAGGRKGAAEPIGFELPDDDFDLNTGMGMGAKIAIALVVLLLVGGAGFYFGVIKNPDMIARMPESIRPTLEKLAGDSGRKKAQKVAKTAQDPIRLLDARLPDANRNDLRNIFARLSLDTPEGYAHAITDMENLIDAVPAEAVPLRALQGLIVTLATFRKAAEGNFEELRIKAESIAGASPDDPIAIDAVALGQLGEGDLEAAAATAESALEKNGDDFFAYYIRALANPPGEEDLKKAIEIRARFSPITIQLARVCIDAGKLEEAKGLLEDVLSRADDHAEARKLLDEIVLPGLSGSAEGEAGAETERSLAAQTTLGKEEAPDTRTPEELLEAAKNLFKEKNYEEAEKLYIRIFDNHYEEIGLRNVALVHYYMGEIYRLTERFEKARAQYEAALEVAPKFDLARQRIEALPDPVPEPEPVPAMEKADTPAE